MLCLCHCRENDVAGVDVNMGCPKDFSLKVILHCTRMLFNVVSGLVGITLFLPLSSLSPPLLLKSDCIALYSPGIRRCSQWFGRDRSLSPCLLPPPPPPSLSLSLSLSTSLFLSLYYPYLPPFPLQDHLYINFSTLS